MRLNLMTRKSITREVSKRYKKASKKEKGRILDEFCALSGYNRSYAAWVPLPQELKALRNNIRRPVVMTPLYSSRWEKISQ